MPDLEQIMWVEHYASLLGKSDCAMTTKEQRWLQKRNGAGNDIDIDVEVVKLEEVYDMYELSSRRILEALLEMQAKYQLTQLHFQR